MTKDLVLFAGLSLLFLLTLLVALSAILRFFDSAPYTEITVVSFVVSYVAAYFILRPKESTLFLGVALTIAVVFVACSICTYLYDRSFDGGSYHKEAVFALANGWNPLNGSVGAWQKEHEVFGTQGVLWIDHYAQGVYSIAACLYAISGSFEAGKSYTLIAMVMAGLICSWYLKEKRFSTRQSVVIALVLAVNPITIPQFTAFYNDALLMMELLVLLVGLFMLADEDAKRFRMLGFAFVGCAFILCAETKFTGFAYAGIFSLAFYILFLIRAIRRTTGFTWKFVGGTSLFFAVTILSSVLVVGYSPYVLNVLDHGHIFYPLFGEGAADIVTSNSPASFADASNIEKLFYSFFSQSDNILADSGREPSLKIPLTVSMGELRSYGAFDMRIGGFGVLYSAILIIQILAIVVLFPGLWKRSRTDASSVLCFLIPMLFLMFFLGESWWARYSSYSYFTNGIALALLFRAWTESRERVRRRIFKWISVAFTTLIIVNSGIFLIHTGHIFLESLTVHKQLAYLEQAARSGQSIEVACTKYPGDVYALETRNIPFEFVGWKDDTFEADGAVNQLYYRIVS